MVERHAANGRAAGVRQLDHRHLNRPGFFRLIGKRAGDPRRPAHRHQRKGKAPDNRNGRRDPLIATPQHQHRGARSQHQRRTRQRHLQGAFQELRRQRGTDKAGDTEAQQHQRQAVHVKARHGHKHRADIGKEGKLPGKGHKDGGHPRQHAGALEQREHVLFMVRRFARQGRQRFPHPNDAEQAHHRRGVEDVTPADNPAEEAAQRRGDHQRDGDRTEDNGKRFRHRPRGHQAHGERGRHRPEAAEPQPQAGATEQQQGEAFREGDQQAGERQQHAEQYDHLAAVDGANHLGDKQAGEHRHEGGDGNGLPRHAFGNAQVLRHWRQQAHRQKLNGNQAGDAERHGKNRRPVGA